MTRVVRALFGLLAHSDQTRSGKAPRLGLERLEGRLALSGFAASHFHAPVLADGLGAAVHVTPTVGISNASPTQGDFNLSGPFHKYV